MEGIMSLSRKTALIVVLLLASVSMGWANTYYVDWNSGQDIAGYDGSAGQPWKTLSYACNRVSTGQHTIHLNASLDYVDNTQAILPLGVDIEGEGMDTTRITTSRSGNWGNAYIQGVSNRSGQSDCVSNGDINEISGFELNGSGRTCRAGMFFQGRDNIVVHDMRFKDIKEIALQVQGWNYDFGGWPDPQNDAPPYWGEGVILHDIEIDNCSLYVDGSPTWAIALGTLKGADIYNIDADMSGQPNTGCPIGTEIRWWDSVKVHDSVFKSWADGGDAFVMEIKSLQNGCQIYNNEFNHGLSLVRGGPVEKVNGKWHVEIFNNTWVMSRDIWSVEGTHRFVHFYGNYIDGQGVGGAYQIANVNCSNGESVECTNFTNGTQIDNNIFFNVGRRGAISVYPYQSVDGVVIVNNTIDGTRVWDYGIQISIGSFTYTNFTIENNIIMNAGTGAIDAGGGDNSFTIRGNIFYNNGGVQGVANPGSSVITGNSITDPGLMLSGAKPAAYWTPVDDSSDAVDNTVISQDVSALHAVDFEGKPRTGTYEIGAIEFDGGGGGGDTGIAPSTPTGLHIIQ
jgi:hypothetical protein